MKTLYLTIPERLMILKALNIKTGIIDTILVNLIISKIQFSPDEIDYAGLADSIKGGVTFDPEKPITKVIKVSTCEARLFKDRFGNNSDYTDLKAKITN